MMDHQARATKKTTSECMLYKNKTKENEQDKEPKKEKHKKVSTKTHTSVELVEEDLRARLPVLFEGTKYERKRQRENNDTGKICSFANDVGCAFSRPE